MMFTRLENISTIEAAEIEAILARGDRPIIQFSTPGYSPELLRQIDRLCATFGPRLEVRFYGHFGTVFDAACLALLPNVASLAIDGNPATVWSTVCYGSKSLGGKSGVGLVADLGLTFNEMYLQWLKLAYTEVSESDEAAWEATGTAGLID